MIFVETATFEDCPEIARVQVEAWQETYAGIVPQSVLDGLDAGRRERFWRRAKEAGSPIAVARSDGAIVGFAGGGPCQDCLPGSVLNFTRSICYAVSSAAAWARACSRRSAPRLQQRVSTT